MINFWVELKRYSIYIHVHVNVYVHRSGTPYYCAKIHEYYLDYNETNYIYRPDMATK